MAKSRKNLAAGDDEFFDEYDGDESFRQARQRSAGRTQLLSPALFPWPARQAQAFVPSTPDAPTEMITKMSCRGTPTRPQLTSSRFEPTPCQSPTNLMVLPAQPDDSISRPRRPPARPPPHMTRFRC